MEVKQIMVYVCSYILYNVSVCMHEPSVHVSKTTGDAD